MGIPQVPEQVRRAPTLALRAVFAGIGRILMSADRPEAGSTQEAGSAAAEGAVAGRTAAESAAGSGLDQRQRAPRWHQGPGARAPAQPNSRWRSLDQTGNVRLLSASDDDDGDSPPAGNVDAGPMAAGPVPAAASMPVLPLAGYDSLSLASIRARLRGLDVSQLKVLLDYEATNAERPEVLGMFERRIEKLESGG
jgi:hypothetical protein